MRRDGETLTTAPATERSFALEPVVNAAKAFEAAATTAGVLRNHA